jgi:hypothetical protein
MSRFILEVIKEELEHAATHIRRAGSYAASKGDKDGAKRAQDVEKKVDELKEDFSKKGK